MTLKHAFDQVRVIDGQKIQFKFALAHLYLSIIKNRLFQVMQGTQTKERQHNRWKRRALRNKWCAGCSKCQLVNMLATPKAS